MTTLLFVLTAVLVGYILYYSLPEQFRRYQQKAEMASHAPRAEAQEPLPDLLSDPGIEDDSIVFRHPVTGETARDPSSYSFARHWVKQALVDEGLLDRLYRNDEMHDEQVKQKIHEALQAFRELEKYRI